MSSGRNAAAVQQVAIISLVTRLPPPIRCYFEIISRAEMIHE